MRQAVLKILPFFLLVVLSAHSADNNIENLKTKRELTSEQKTEADELIKKINSEKERLKAVRVPLNKAEEALKAPEAELRTLKKHLSTISNFVNDNEKKDPKSDAIKNGFKDTLVPAAKELGGGGKKLAGLAKEILELSFSLTKAKGDQKKSNEITGKLRGKKADFDDASEKITAKIQKKVTELDQEKRKEQAKFEKECQTLNTLRAKLKLIYGYKVDNASLLFMGKDNNVGAAVTMWINEQGQLVEALSAWGYEDLASQFFTKLQNSKNPFDGSAFSDAQISYISKIGARLNKHKSIYSDDLVEKILLAQSSLAIFEEVVTKLVPQTPMHNDATIDLLDSRFSIAASLYTQAWKSALLDGKLPILANNLSSPKPATASKKKGAKAPAKPAAPKPFTEAELKAMDPAQLRQTAVNLAYTYLSKGLQAGNPLQKRNYDTFLDLIDNFTMAQDDGDEQKAARALKMLERFSPGKLRLQHSMEEGYSLIPMVIPFDASQRKTYLESGKLFIQDNLSDYQQIWPHDKRVYMYWMEMDSNQLDPVLQRTDKDKPLPQFVVPDPEAWGDYSKSEKREEMLNLDNYPWASTRVDNLFNWYIVGKAKNENAKQGLIQQQRERGLYSWIKSRALLSMNHWLKAAAETDAEKKKQWEDHAKKLQDKALESFNQLNDSMTIIGTVSPDIRNKIKLELILPYYLFLADHEIKAGNKEVASKWSSLALNEAAAVKGTAEGAWIRLSKNALLLAGEFGKKNGLGDSDDPEKWPAALLATKAEDLMREGFKLRNDGKVAEAKKNFEKSYDLYLLMLDKSRSLTSKSKRAKMLPKALYNFGTICIQLEDYLNSIIAFQALVQEFRNDFKNPEMNYPPEQYKDPAKYFATSLNNLRAAAAKQLARRGNSLDRRNYVEALLMNVRSSGRGEDYVALIDTFIKMKEYLSAVQFIENVPKANDYYRITQLMAASIFVTMIKQDMNEIAKLEEKINPTPDEDGNIPEDMKFSTEEKTKFKARQDELHKQVVEYRKQAKSYSDKFIRLHKLALEKWKKDAAAGIKVAPSVENIRKQEKQNLLQAMLIPMSIALESGDSAEVTKLAPVYFQTIDEQKDLPEEAKQEYRVKAAWILFNATYRQVDYMKAPLAEAVKNLQLAESIQKNLAKYDTSEKYLTTAASILGGAWMTVANRAKKANNEAQEKEYSLKSVNWLLLAEKQIYNKAPLGISMGQTLTQYKMYNQAEEVLQKVVNFWAESLFTNSSLFAKDKGLAGMKAMEPAVAAQLSAPLKASTLSAASSDKALEAALNNLILTVKYEDNADAFNKALETAQKDFKDRKGLIKSVEQGIRLAASFNKPSKLAALTLGKRPYLNTEPDKQVRNRLNRILLEVAYPDVLYRQPIVPLLPSPAITAEQPQRILRQYLSPAGRKKAAVLMAMIDPLSISGTSAFTMVYGEPSEKGKGGLVGEMLKKIKESSDDAEKAQLQSWVNALENPLMVSLYGEKDKKGILRKRSYGRAQLNVMAMQSYDKAIKTSETLPIDDYIKELTRALGFQSQILIAKKDYARAMVENSQYVKAEKYVKELNALFPSDWSLTLDLGKIYTSMASRERQGDKLVARTFSKDAAKYYMQGMIQINSILKFSPPGSEPYWSATMLSYENDLKFVESRVKGPAALKSSFDVEISYFDPKSSKSRILKKTIDPLMTVDGKLGQGDRLAVDLKRTINRSDPAASKENKARLQEMLDKLAKLGFKPPVMK